MKESSSLAVVIGAGGMGGPGKGRLITVLGVGGSGPLTEAEITPLLGFFFLFFLPLFLFRCGVCVCVFFCWCFFCISVLSLINDVCL